MNTELNISLGGDLESCPPRNLGGYRLWSVRVVFAEDAAVVVLMVIFGAGNAAAEERVNFSSDEHGKERRGKVNPQRVPEMREKGTGESAGRIHAHAGNR